MYIMNGLIGEAVMRTVFGLLVICGVVAAQDDESPETLTVEKEWKGGATAITTAEFHRIADEPAWTALWQRHTAKKDQAPRVDFTRNMVVACFLGPVTFDEVSVYAVRRTKDEVVFGLGVEEKECCDFSTSPQFCIAVIPRSKLKLSIIQRVKQDFDVDPKKDKLLKEMDALAE